MVEDQAGHEASKACLRELFERGYRMIAPEVYFFEMGNALSRGAGDPAHKSRMLLAACALVDRLPLSEDAAARAMDLASAKRLSFYDASYAAIAAELDVPLWTEDKEILKKIPERAAATAEILQRATG